VTIRAIGGLVVFNFCILGTGAGVLWGLRGWRWWTDFVRLAGVAYMLGVASLTVLLTLELVLGIPVTLATIVLSCILLVGSGLVAGRVRGHSSPALRPPGWHFPGLSLFAALFVAGIVVYLEGLFRVGRLSSIVGDWDSWAFWVPKAQTIYWSGRLEPEFLSLLPGGASYPPGLPALHAGAFHAMGSADTVTLHLQYWFYAAGFVAAVAGLLARRVHQAILFPILLLALIAPSLVERTTMAYGDIPLAYLVALAALLVVLWVEEQRIWQLAAATVLLSGAMLTKREGILFAICVLLAGFVASWKERHLVWKRLVAAGLVSFALSLPWRIWFTAHGLPSDAPDAGYLGAFDHLDRVWPSFKLVVTTLFDADLWPVLPALAIAAIVLAALGGAWRVSVYGAVFTAAVVVTTTWAIWSNITLQFTQYDATNPIVRVTSTPILAFAALTPLLLERAWSGTNVGRRVQSNAETPWRDAFVWSSRWMWAVVLLAALSHPGAMLAGYSKSGLPGGPPRFPSAAACTSTPAVGERVRVVLGYADSYPEANALRGRAVAAGLARTEVAHDGCGRLRVFVDDVPSVAASEPLLSDARRASLEPTLELDTD
jgi:hypothetical protein